MTPDSLAYPARLSGVINGLFNRLPHVTTPL